MFQADLTQKKTYEGQKVLLKISEVYGQSASTRNWYICYIFNGSVVYQGIFIIKKIIQGPYLTDQMCYHSQVLKNQQSFLKLLSRENHEMGKEPQHCVMCAYVSGATSSDFCSRYTCVGQLQKIEMLQQVHHNFYVNDPVKPMIQPDIL